MIKISPKTERLIYENQERNYGGVVPPQFGVKGQVKNYFSSRGNNVEFRLRFVFRFLARLGFYKPLVYVLEKQ